MLYHIVKILKLQIPTALFVISENISNNFDKILYHWGNINIVSYRENFKGAIP